MLDCSKLQKAELAVLLSLGRGGEKAAHVRLVVEKVELIVIIFTFTSHFQCEWISYMSIYWEDYLSKRKPNLA